MALLSFIVEKWKILGLLILMVLVAQLVFIKPRWQFYPLYFVAAAYFGLVLLNSLGVFSLSNRNSKWILGVGISLILISIVLILILPKEKLPTPSGEFKIGTRTFDLVDFSREEIYTDVKGDRRKIKYQIWYPADETKGYKRAKWINDGKALSRQLASSMYLPSFMLDHTVQINSHSYLDAPLSGAEDTFPIVVISHGWSGFRELHTDFAEELASNGYMAISIDHTYGSQAVKFEDNTVAYINKEALPSQANQAKFSKASNLLATTYGEDVAYVLDDLERLNQTHEDFKNRLNLDAIGVLGHSTGGGGDVYIALKDPRIKALMGLDAWVNPIEPEILKQGLTIPSLFLRSEQWSVGPNNRALNLIFNNSTNARLVQMDKTNHVDFSMAYMYSPITKYIGFTGKLGGRKSSRIQQEFIMGFFDRHIKGIGDAQDTYLEDIARQYDNVSLIDVN